jgi:hypothetical protein
MGKMKAYLVQFQDIEDVIDAPSEGEARREFADKYGVYSFQGQIDVTFLYDDEE